MKKRGLDERINDAESLQAVGVDRREILARIIGGSVAAAGGLVLAADAHAAEDQRKVFEVAALGHTFAFSLAPGATDPGNWRGTTFFVEGDLYRRGTIPIGVENWDPSGRRRLAIGSPAAGLSIGSVALAKKTGRNRRVSCTTNSSSVGSRPIASSRRTS
jgi:hypothetical protein